jgi:hypothetical protein
MVTGTLLRRYAYRQTQLDLCPAEVAADTLRSSHCSVEQRGNHEDKS